MVNEYVIEDFVELIMNVFGALFPVIALVIGIYLRLRYVDVMLLIIAVLLIRLNYNVNKLKK